MRLLRTGLVALVTAPFAVAAGGTATADRPAGPCALPPGLVAPALPAAVRIATSCGVFRIAPDGRIARVSSDPPRVGWLASNGVWGRSDRGHLLVGRWQRTLWRSPGRVSHAWTVDNIVVGPHELAFSSEWRDPILYVAAIDGRQRRVARGEFPLGGTSSGFYTRRLRNAELVLRSGAGRRLDTIARYVGTYAYAPDDRSLLFVEHGRLLRAQRARIRPVAELSRLGVPARHLQILPLGRLIGLWAARRLVVLRADGSLFASTPLPFATGRIEFVSGGPTVAPHDAAVAFAVIRGDPGESEVMERGIETVYVLRPGKRAAVAVDRQRMWFDVCGHTAALAWHGNWLLYAADGGGAAAVDVDGGRVIGLGSIARRVPGFPRSDPAGFFTVSWA